MNESKKHKMPSDGINRRTLLRSSFRQLSVTGTVSGTMKGRPGSGGEVALPFQAEGIRISGNWIQDYAVAVRFLPESVRGQHRQRDYRA